MPPKQKITKEMIIAQGYQMTRKYGIEVVNSRNIAKELNCSTQPVFSQFETMEQLRQAVYQFAAEKFEKEVLNAEAGASFLRSSYLKLAALAREESQLFRLIFFSDYCRGRDFFQIRMTYASNRRIFEELKERYQLRESECRDVFERGSLLIHGIASLRATAEVDYTDEKIVEMMEQTIDDMAEGVKKRRRQRDTPLKTDVRKEDEQQVQKGGK